MLVRQCPHVITFRSHRQVAVARTSLPLHDPLAHLPRLADGQLDVLRPALLPPPSPSLPAFTTHHNTPRVHTHTTNRPLARTHAHCTVSWSLYGRRPHKHSPKSTFTYPWRALPAHHRPDPRRSSERAPEPGPGSAPRYGDRGRNRFCARAQSSSLTKGSSARSLLLIVILCL